MEYKIIGNIHKNEYTHVAYQCPGCQASLRSPLLDAGSTEHCSGCGIEVIVPGQTELEQLKLQQAQNVAEGEERIQAHRDPLEEARLKANGARASKKSYNSNWYHIVNRWLVDNLAALNAIVFFLAILAFAISFASQGRGGQVLLFLIIGAIAGALVGMIYCGLFAIILSYSKDISRIADALEKRNSNSE